MVLADYCANCRRWSESGKLGLLRAAAVEFRRPLYQRLWRRIDVLENLLHLLAADRVDIEHSFLGLGQEGSIFHRVVESVTDSDDEFFRRSRRHHERPPHVLRKEQELNEFTVLGIGDAVDH